MLFIFLFFFKNKSKKFFIYENIKNVGTKNIGDYSSNISRIFNNINNKYKNVINDINVKDEYINDENNELENNNKLKCYNEYENVINKINFNKMLGRDLSYCMNILSKIKYFNKNEFWLKCCNKLIKGNMIHRINIHSYFLIANSLSKISFLISTVSNINDLKIKKKKNKNEHEDSNKIYLYEKSIPLTNIHFEYIYFNGNVEIKKENLNIYHKIYDEIAIRFLMNLESMTLDCICCILHFFSKLKLYDYNILYYYFVDYIMYISLKKEIKKKK